MPFRTADAAITVMGSPSRVDGCAASPGTGEAPRDSRHRYAGINAGMSEPWTPSLTVRERGGRCRLYLAPDAWGDGATLQEAADDLIARLVLLARALRAGGWTWAHE